MAATEVVEIGDELPTALYRCYNSHDVLLYIGISDNLRRRWERHARERPWWPAVTRKTVQWYGTRAEAELAETEAIHDERPIFNVQCHAEDVDVPRPSRRFIPRPQPAPEARPRPARPACGPLKGERVVFIGGDWVGQTGVMRLEADSPNGNCVVAFDDGKSHYYLMHEDDVTNVRRIEGAPVRTEEDWALPMCSPRMDMSQCGICGPYEGVQ